MDGSVDINLQIGIAAHEMGNYTLAEETYRKILLSEPNHAEANGFLALVMASSGQCLEALPYFYTATEAMPENAQLWLNLIDALLLNNSFEDAKVAIEQARAAGVAEMHLSARELDVLQAIIDENLREAESGDESGSRIELESPAGLGITVQSRQSPSAAISGDLSQDLISELLRLTQASDFEGAEALARAIINDFPEHPFAWKALGVIYKLTDRLIDSVDANRHALVVSPNDWEIHSNLGDVLRELGQLEESEAVLRHGTSLNPNFAEAFNNLGLALHDMHRLSEAESSYEQAVTLKPEYAVAHHNLGITLQEQGRLDEAEVSSRLAIALDQSLAEAHNNLALTLQYQGRLDEAIASFERAVALNPEYAVAEAQLLHQRRHICDFSVSEVVSEASSRLGIVGGAIPPFIALTWSDSPEQNLRRAEAYASEKYRQSSDCPAVAPSSSAKRLKIGYFSADFHSFPGMYLMAGLLESHDRERFEVYAFSYGPEKNDAMRQRIVGAVDHFIDIRDMSTSEVVQLSRDEGIDIAIHRNGYTTNARTELFQKRLAPVQISYLGYPSTLGADFIDYIVADPVVIPEEQRQFYSEKVIYLPDTYQPNDDTREIADTDTTRADFGLPEDAFVFCCFNQNYKISAQEFDIWMRVLKAVDGSVLWLLKSNRWAEENLRQEAINRGVDSSRIVFAERLPQAEHLARHKHADLFIDTFNYNAHTTASDALWAGLPIVTKQGKQFAARVAASLLTAVGLPQLITDTEEGYEHLILELARNPERLSNIRETLSANRRTEPLFDTQRYTRHFEQGLCRVYDLYAAGRRPSDLRIG